jgi:hypothetical protein
LICSLHSGRSPQQVERQLCGSNFRNPSTREWSFPVIGFDKISATLPTLQGMAERLIWRRNCGEITRFRVEETNSRSLAVN